MPTSWRVELPNGKRWGIIYGVFDGPGCVCVPIDQVKGMSQGEIGQAVESLLREAESAEAHEIANWWYNSDYLIDVPSDILAGWYATLTKFRHEHDNLYRAWEMTGQEIQRRYNREINHYRSRPKTPSVQRPGYVYLLKAGPYYKIGVSSKVSERIKQLSTLPPFDLELIHTVLTDDMYNLEKDLHERYAAKRKNGEWFELDVSDVEYIKGL